MPEDFAIDFSYWIYPAQKNQMDTFSGKIQKDLVMNGVATSAFACEKEDLEAIYAKMKELKIFELSGHLISDNVQVTPNEIFQIRYRINGQEFIISGDGSTEMTDDIRGSHLHEFMEYLRDFMTGTLEYQAMPKQEGGYD